MSNELKLYSGGTTFRFFFSDKGYNDGDYFWTDACISVENRYFNYQTGSGFLEFSELKEINDSLINLLNDCITEKRKLEFLEPDLQISLNPKFDKRNDQQYTYIKEGFEIEDISAEFIFYLSLDDGYSEEHYTLPLYRSDIEQLVEFLSEKIEGFEKY